MQSSPVQSRVQVLHSPKITQILGNHSVILYSNLIRVLTTVIRVTYVQCIVEDQARNDVRMDP